MAHLTDLPAELLIQIIDLLLPSEIVQVLQAVKGLAWHITPQHVQIQDKRGRTILHYLVTSQGDVHDVMKQILLSQKLNCSIPDISGETPLLLAAQNRDEKAVELLLQAGADITTVYAGGNNIMFQIRHFLNERITRLLIGAGADISCRDHYENNTMLVYAIQCREQGVVRALLEAGADVNAQVRRGLAWMHAIFEDDNQMVQLFLEAGADIHFKLSSGRTPLMAAASRNRYQILQTLLDAGAALSAQCNEGFTALHIAAQQGHEKIVRLLLDAGANIHLLTTRGWCLSVLHLAAAAGSANIIRMLLDAGVDINVRDSGGRTVLSAAIAETPFSSNDVSVVKLLLDSGVDPSAKDISGQTALHEAALRSLDGIVKLLIEAGVDVSTTCRKGMTALHYTAMSQGIYPRRMKSAQQLLGAGVDPSVRNTRGLTALHLAAEYKQDGILQCLLEASVDVSAIDNRGRTALHIAAQQDWYKVQDLISAGIGVSVRDNRGWTAQNHAARWKFHSIAKIIHDAEVAADPAVLSQTCLGLSMSDIDRQPVALILDQNLRHLHTKCHRSGTTHCLTDVIQDLCVIGDVKRVRVLFETWRAEMPKAVPFSDVLSYNVVQEALIIAARNRHAAIVAYFLGLGVPITYMVTMDGILIRNNRETSLMLCIGHSSLIKWHLDHGADTSLRDSNRNNVLETAAVYGDLNTVKLLVEYGNMKLKDSSALIKATGFRGPAMEAYGPKPNWVELMRYLLDRGADVNRTEDLWGRAWHGAIDVGSDEQLRLLLGRGADPDIEGAFIDLGHLAFILRDD
ncbi:hypothetical protein AJ79_01317 [Helicocarpus griseus UAMH5409]|uniref:Uncharacterized protein n=1 Tax=Helicocarpus griseus UAMH5409 TaxID=1447875 RepID=A0A2B7Y7V1_9EURO|nr:hypothetical protein AJ79_01317 [Helicocarpus griseus UAMH5409]